MACERCWRCKKNTNDVKLRACDDRLCEACYLENEKALQALRTGNNRGSGSGADKHIDHTKTCKKSSSSASKDVKPDTVPVISGSPNRFCQACKDSITCEEFVACDICKICLLYTSPSPRDRTRSRMPSSA